MSGASEPVLGLARRGRLPHGMLWLGNDPGPKRAAAVDLAREIFCERPSDAPPCGSCPACRKAEKGLHPDLRFVAPEGKEIRIETVRELSRWLLVAPNEAPRKIGILEEADLLNVSSANALLKTLEEPPSHAVILLFARQASNLLPTVRSRLMPIRFPSPSEGDPVEGELPPWGNELERILHGESRPAPEEIFELTEAIARDKENLRWFFRVGERSLRDRILQARDEGQSARERRLEALFDLTRAAERDLLQRYGNAPLTLDRLLTEWLL